MSKSLDGGEACCIRYGTDRPTDLRTLELRILMKERLPRCFHIKSNLCEAVLNNFHIGRTKDKVCCSRASHLKNDFLFILMLGIGSKICEPRTNDDNVV